jgi:hypothetical protein
MSRAIDATDRGSPSAPGMAESVTETSIALPSLRIIWVS